MKKPLRILMIPNISGAGSMSGLGCQFESSQDKPIVFKTERKAISFLNSIYKKIYDYDLKHYRKNKLTPYKEFGLVTLKKLKARRYYTSPGFLGLNIVDWYEVFFIY